MPTIVTGSGDSHISIPAGNFDGRPIIDGADSHVSEPINLGGEPEAPGDRFGASSPVEPEPPVEPKPENPKLKEARGDRWEKCLKYQKYEHKTDKTFDAKCGKS